ncbi:unnamed protein product [Owenia fusiformis]|uniref:3-hydroxyisobutyrate dehydrogenase n=1 Tax=Owenia fusiformis TaxID=6347 RepID=A0A8J1Y0K2_OWEFU|nr:unnamed protein product [Owenia fusiformis]
MAGLQKIRFLLLKPNIQLKSISNALSTSQSLYKQPIGFVGLGNMGNHMANNLIKNGYPVIAYDVNAESLRSLENAGGKVGDSPAAIATQVDQIVTMLPSSPHVLDVYNGPNGILSSVKAGTLLLDSSTIDPAVSQQVAALAAKKGAVYMDAPVSGGVNAARDAILTFMVGGPEAEFDAAKDILNNMGKNVVYCGGVGTGEAAKICNNMLLGISMIGTAEAFNLGIKLGIEPKKLAEIINMSSGRCWSSELYNPCPGVKEGVPSSNNYQGGFGTALMTKDLGLAQDAATVNKSATPLGSLAHQIYRIMCTKGYALKDFSSAFLFLQEDKENKS